MQHEDLIYVPGRYCMNLAATVNMILYDRQTKASVSEHDLKGSK